MSRVPEGWLIVSHVQRTASALSRWKKKNSTQISRMTGLVGRTSHCSWCHWFTPEINVTNLDTPTNNISENGKRQNLNIKASSDRVAIYLAKDLLQIYREITSKISQHKSKSWTNVEWLWLFDSQCSTNGRGARRRRDGQLRTTKKAVPGRRGLWLPCLEQIHFPSATVSVISTPWASADCNRLQTRGVLSSTGRGQSIATDEATAAAAAAVERETIIWTNSSMTNSSPLNVSRSPTAHVNYWYNYTSKYWHCSNVYMCTLRAAVVHGRWTDTLTCDVS